MDPRKDANLKRQHSIDLPAQRSDSLEGCSSKQPRFAPEDLPEDPNPAQLALIHPRDLPLQTKDGILLANLRTRMNHEITTRHLDGNNFAKKMINCSGFLTLKNRLGGGARPLPTGNDVEISGNAHFQVYDWLMLSEEDQMKVLDGQPPVNGHFEKPHDAPGPLLDRFHQVRQLRLRYRNGTIIVENLRQRLNCELCTENFTCTQFAFRVFNKALGAGYLIKAFIDNNPRLQPDQRFLEIIRVWVEMRECDRKAVMNGYLATYRDVRRLGRVVDLRRRPPPTDVPRAHLEYLANPDTFDIRDPRYRRCMQPVLNKHLSVLEDNGIRINGPFGRGTSPEHKNLLRQMMQEFQVVRRFLHFEIDTLTRPDLLKGLGFMYGMQIDQYKTAECIKYVLAARSQNHGDFAEIVLGTTAGIFESLITSTAHHTIRAVDTDLFLAMGIYMLKSGKERKAAWIDGCRADHLDFLKNPYTFDFDRPGFKRRMKIVADPQLEILQQEHPRDKEVFRRELEEETRVLLAFLSDSRRYNHYNLRARVQIISLSHMDGVTMDWNKMAECIGSVLDAQKKELFAVNVLNCSLQDFEFLLASPMQHLLANGNNTHHFIKIHNYLFMNDANRRIALNGRS